jgi:hypothetical protein
MTSMNTQGRVFAAQLSRDLLARQRAAAARLYPGTDNWIDALTGSRVRP